MDVVVAMYRKKCNDDSWGSLMFDWESTGNTAGYRKKTIYSGSISHRTIYTGAYSYCAMVRLAPTGDIRINSVRIAYSL